MLLHLNHIDSVTSLTIPPTLRQGEGKVSEYDLEFHILAAESTWNETAIQAVFYQRLGMDNLTRDRKSEAEPSLDPCCWFGHVYLTSPASVGFFFVEKKEGDLRSCIDYRRLNNVSVKYTYLLPLIPAAIEQIFTKLDLCSAYNFIINQNQNQNRRRMENRIQYNYWSLPFLGNDLARCQVFSSVS